MADIEGMETHGLLAPVSKGQQIRETGECSEMEAPAL